VNDIWSALQALPTKQPDEPGLQPFTYPDLPGKCPYPKLQELGFIQPRPGAFLRTESPPEPITTFTSELEFEQYIYSLAFHRDISPRTGKMIMSAFLDRKNTKFLTKTAFRYAITALVERAAEIYSARRLAEYMTLLNIPLDIKIYNLFLLASMNVESLRSFSLTLREILNRRDIQSDSTTWNIVLRMGLKLNSPNWVYSVLEVMRSRKIPLDHDAIQAVFITLRGVVDSGQLKDYYLRQLHHEKVVPWKPLNVVLHALCDDKKIDEAWDLLIDTAKKESPPEATLHMFITRCRKNDDYERVWTIIGESRRRWSIEPTSRGVASLFEFAFQREEFSDAILIWQYAEINKMRWKMSRRMYYRGRDLEREYGVPLDRPMSKDEVAKAWVDATTGNRNPDVFHRIVRSSREHVRMMRAKKHSEQLAEDQDISEDVARWREIERTYDAAVAAGVWKPRDPPRDVPIPNPVRQYNRHGNIMKPVPIDPIPNRLKSGLNFAVKEKVMVWEMVQRGAIKL